MIRKTGCWTTLLWLAALAAAQAGPLDSGNALYGSGQYGQAVTAFQQAVAQTQGAEQAKAYYKLGNAYHKLHQDGQALDAYNHARQDDPSLSFASSPQKFEEAVSRVAGGGSVGTGSTAIQPRSSGAGEAGGAAPDRDPASLALSSGNVYVDPRIHGVDQGRLQQAAMQAQGDPHTLVKIAMLGTLPRGYRSVAEYAVKLHQYLNLGKNGLVAVVLSGPTEQTRGVTVVTDGLNQDESARLAQRYVAAIGANPTEGTAQLAQAVAADINGKEYRGTSILWIIFLVIAGVIIALVVSASRRRKQQLAQARVPVEALRENVLSGIEYLDGYMDVLPKNNPDSDQVRAFRQSASGKFDQAAKVLDHATELSDIQRAQGLLQAAHQDVEQARKYLDRTTGGTGNIPGDDAVRPQPLPESQPEVQAIPADQRGVSFFSSQPAPLGTLVPVTITVGGQSRQVLATPEEADDLRRGRMPQVRAFNVGGREIPWYEYDGYDPYRDYWRYQNAGWGGFGNGVLAGFVGAELLGSLFAPSYGYGGGYAPYAFATDMDYYRGYNDAIQSDRAANYGFGNGGFGGDNFGGGYDNSNSQTYDNAGSASFMGNSGPGYDTQDYGNAGSASFMGDGGGAASVVATSPEPLRLPGVGALGAGPPGAAETVLYLHGWGGSKELWWNTLAALGSDVQGVALDLPGTGDTPLSGDIRTMPDIARWVAGVCARLELSSVTLVGHSLGGNLAAQVALDFPGLARRLVLVDAALDPSSLPRHGRWPLSARYGLTALRLSRLAAWPLAVAGRRIPHAHSGGQWLPYARRSHLYLSFNTDEAMQTQLRALYDNPHGAERLAALTIPLLIMHGQRDGIVPIAHARALAHALPQSRLVIFPDAQHCPMDTDPSLFAQRLRDFLTTAPPCATMEAAPSPLQETQ